MPDATISNRIPFIGGHPWGILALFFTEMWERLSYYGMRALLVLFMVDQMESGGMGMTVATAGAIYGLYTAGVYLAALPGGWAADRLFGAQRAVWYGGIIIAAGHFTLAIPGEKTFFIGLLLVVLGTGLLKPNISAIVGQLYPEGGARRDAGFTLFYMGINLGALIGPLICGYLGERVDWHYGFGAAGYGMVAGLLVYRYTTPLLGDAGRHPASEPSTRGRDMGIFALGVIGVVAVTLAGIFGLLPIDVVTLAKGTTYFIVGIAVLYFGSVFIYGGLEPAESKRIWVIVVLFVTSAIFWAGFEQAGSSLNLFAADYTDRIIELKDGSFWEFPASWFQSANPTFIVIFAPVVASLWVTLARSQKEPSLPAKFAYALVLLGLGFAVMAAGSKIVAAGGKAAPTWLLMTYLLHTLGELCLSPVGLSSVTKLAPKRLVGQMMGTWFLATSLGNLIAGLFAGRFDPESAADMPSIFMELVIVAGAAAALLLVFAVPIKRLMGGVK